MKFEYGNGCQCEKRLRTTIEDGIKNFLKRNFGQRYDELKVIKFLPEDSDEFKAQTDGIAITAERKIILKFDMFAQYYENSLDAEFESQMFNTLVHEMQHIVNTKDLQELFTAIEKTNTLTYVKVGMNHLADEYLAAYKAHKKIPEVYSGVLDYIVNIPQDVCEKKAEPLKLYLTIIDIISWFIGETRAIYEVQGIDEWSKRCKDINDEEMVHILSAAREATKVLDKMELENYLRKSEDVSKRLLRYVGADFEFLKKLDEYMENRR